jgi:CheY-like chemotaxis protein
MGAGDNLSGADASKIDKIRERKHKILVIDDTDKFRKAFCFNLKRKYNAQVDGVNSGEAGIEKLKGGNSYDFVFTDIMMPGMTGIDVYHELQKLGIEIRIVIMSAYSDSDAWKEAQALNVPLLHKPIPEDQLIEILGT